MEKRCQTKYDDNSSLGIAYKFDVNSYHKFHSIRIVKISII